MNWASHEARVTSAGLAISIFIACAPQASPPPVAPPLSPPATVQAPSALPSSPPATAAASSANAIETRIGKLTLESGYPSPETVSKLYDELDFQRAVQAYVWATPIVSLDALRVANKIDWNVDFNTVGMVDQFTEPNVEALTANNTTIYAIGFVDLTRDGPVVIDSPPGAYGVIDDYWQRPIVEIGPFGPDKGQGGKFLLLPADYREPVPKGYLAVRSTTNRVLYLVRGLVKEGNVQGAVDTLSKIAVYPLKQAAKPPLTTVVKSAGRPLKSIPPSGYAYWERLADIINHETVEPRDRFFYAMLKPLGIEKGKPFAPDARQKRLLTEAATVGFRMAQALSMAPRLDNAASYPGTRWEWVLTLNPDQEAANHSQLDERTDYTFEAITVAAGMVKKIEGAGSQYMSVAKDKSGASQQLMMKRARVPEVSGLIILLALGHVSFASAQGSAAPAQPGRAPAAPAAAGPTQDIGWPRHRVKDGATLVYYQPQLDEWKDYKQLKCRVAFALTPRGELQILGRVARREHDRRH